MSVDRAYVPPATASWIIRDKDTGEVIAETFNKGLVDLLNTDRFEAIPILDYLASLNRKPHYDRD